MDMLELDAILARSRATEAFKHDVRAYAEHRGAPRIGVSRLAPHVKVLRVIAQLLSAEPTFGVDRVQLEASSGCSDFRGALAAESADGQARVFDFRWDCHWRALQEGWTDAFGLPDQIRAARVHGWRCFAEWRERPRPAPGIPGHAAVHGEGERH